MQFKLTINLGNEAMQTDNDIARALRRVVWEVEGGIDNYSGIIKDINGNSVGSYAIEGN